MSEHDADQTREPVIPGDTDLTQELRLAGDADLTQELQLAGNTGNLYLSPDETVELSEVMSDDLSGDAPFKIGKHSILPVGIAAGDDAFAPKTQSADDAQEPDDPLARAPRKRHRGLVVFLVLLITCALVAAAAWFIYHYRQHQEALVPHPVWVRIDAPGYDMVDSKIPFHAVGHDMDGNVVDTVCFVGPDGTGIELPRGSYEIEVASSPLLDDAQFYEVPDMRGAVEIPADTEDGVTIEVNHPTFEFMFANPADITDEQIDVAYDYAIESGFDAGKADSYRAALVRKRDEALAVALAAAEKAQRITAATEALEAKAKESGTTGVGYQLADLDGDEMPELLLVGNSASAIGAVGSVYAYDAFSHQVVELASAAGGANHSPGIWYSTARHEVVFATTGTNTETFSFYSISSGVAVLEYTYTHSWGQQGEDPTATESFFIGSDPITEQTFSTMVSGLSRYSYLASPAL